MQIGNYTFDEFLSLVEAFHGSAAPGVVLGGIMVDAAIKRLPEGILYDALAETRACLPDAVQLLTPCTIGNGWLKIVNLGRFALSLYDKYTGQGVRVSLDPAKVKGFPEIEAWYLKLKPKRQQDKDLLLAQIREAGEQVLTWEQVQMRPHFVGKKSRGGMAVCPLCREGYPAQDGGICRACQGEAPFYERDEAGEAARPEGPSLTAVPVEQALGRRLLHDMTQIIPGESKGPVFHKDQIITVGDLCRLQQMGRHHLYVAEDKPADSQWVHENEAALAFAGALAGEGVIFAGPARARELPDHLRTLPGAHPGAHGEQSPAA